MPASGLRDVKVRFLNRPIDVGSDGRFRVSTTRAAGFGAVTAELDGYVPASSSVDADTPSVFIVSQSSVYDKVMSNLQEVKARGGPVIAIVDKVDDQLRSLADDVIEIPSCEDFLQPIGFPFLLAPNPT